jgi:hypothetical protein
MADPGLVSKFVEMQQEDATRVEVRQESPVSSEQESRRMDRARLLAQLESARNPFYRRILLRALESIEGQ